MCSFIFVVTKKEYDIKKIKNANQFIKSRGPDKTNFLEWNCEKYKYYAVHNLLDISGHSILQPLKDNSEKMLLFNGEIYNLVDKKTIDTLEIYENFKINNLKSYLERSNGEYAICAYEPSKKLISLYKDLIGTKPLFYGFSKDTFAISSYKSSLVSLNLSEIKEINPNTNLNIDIKNLSKPKFKELTMKRFDLNQHVKEFKDWNSNFINAVKMRASHFNTNFFVPLSSGYDSGAICCALNYLNIPYVTVSIGDSENQSIIDERVKINCSKSCTSHIELEPMSIREKYRIERFLLKKIGDVKYDHLDDKRSNYPISLHEDTGALGLTLICEEMSKRNFNAMICGTGADEIISDYGFNGHKFASHSEFGGLFPDDLSIIFPWKKFYFDSQKSYLKKDEMVSGIFGIEGRYPFLDKDLIQSFLNLEVNLKNSRYKNCIASFLELNSYPYEENVKKGFNPYKTKISLASRLINKIYTIFSKIY